MVLPDLNFTPHAAEEEPGRDEDVMGDEEPGGDEDVGGNGGDEEPGGDEDVGGNGGDEEPGGNEDVGGNEEAGAERPHHTDLPDTHRFAAFIALKALSKDRVIIKSYKEHVAALLKTRMRNVERVWNQANEQLGRGEEVDVFIKRKGRCGRKRSELGLTRIPSIPLNKRSTLRALAGSLDVPYSTLQRRFKWGEIRRHTSSLKPSLKPENKLSRLKFCTEMIDQTTIHNDMPSFVDMQNIVHIDEKWFDMTKKKRTYYLLPENKIPCALFTTRTISARSCS